jgi:hybrid cluster-associated redox disulfide protein
MTSALPKQRITKDMLISDIISRYPSLINILFAEGIHCIGCHGAAYETLEQGLASHGKTPGEINAIIAKLTTSIPKIKGTPALSITESALRKLAVIIKEKKQPGIRISSQHDASGIMFGFAFDKKKKDDTTITIKPVTFFIDKQTSKHLKGSRIEYAETPAGAGFCIIPPMRPSLSKRKK